MQVLLDKQPQPLSVDARALALGSEATELRLVLAADEELASASLTLQRYSGDEGPSFVEPRLETDVESDGTTGISWIKADWGGARALRRFSLAFSSAIGLRVRVQIARGRSAWFPPPGPHTFDVADSYKPTTLNGSFPDTIADRVMFEFLERAQGAPAKVTLAGEGLRLEFGRMARDLALGLTASRAFFNHASELIAGSPLVLDDLLDTLVRELGAPLGDREIAIEMTATVEGLAELGWEFASDRIVREFADGASERRLRLPWHGGIAEPLKIEPPGRPERVELALVRRAARERIVLGPARPDALPAARGVLCRPLYDNAQPFALDGNEMLTGVDLWARPLTGRVKLRVDLRADEAGQPASAPSQTLAGTLELDNPRAVDAPPAWWSVTFESPARAPSGRAWLVVRADEGELVWFVADGERPAQASAPRYRRNDGDWLEREARAQAERAGTWTLARLRAASDRTPPPLMSTLACVALDDSETSYALPEPDADGFVRWRAGEVHGEVAQAKRLEIRIASEVACEVALSHLRVGYRVSESG